MASRLVTTLPDAASRPRDRRRCGTPRNGPFNRVVRIRVASGTCGTIGSRARTDRRLTSPRRATSSDVQGIVSRISCTVGLGWDVMWVNTTFGSPPLVTMSTYWT